jgi:phosphorylcholine metabolism protein LicD
MAYQTIRIPEHKLLSKIDKDILYEIVDLMTDIRETFNIKINACGGTLLGAVRGGDVIPWDDDLDFMVKESEFDKIQEYEVIEFINRKGFMIFIETHPYWMNVYHIYKPENSEKVIKGLITVSQGQWNAIIKGKDLEKKPMNCLAADIFKWKMIERDTYNIHTVSMTRNQIIKQEQLKESISYPFGKTRVWSIQNPEEYLVNTYGKDWKKPIFTHTHR